MLTPYSAVARERLPAVLAAAGADEGTWTEDKTDALAEKKVRIVDEFPVSSYPPITYPIALTKGASPEAQRFEDFVTSAAARPIFLKYGFQPVR